MLILFVLTNHSFNQCESFVLQTEAPTECMVSDGIFRMLILNYTSHPSLTRNEVETQLRSIFKVEFQFVFFKNKHLRKIIGWVLCVLWGACIVFCEWAFSLEEGWASGCPSQGLESLRLSKLFLMQARILVFPSVRVKCNFA